jgi:AICAR transformylase/IMP cyclohydrolase PurH
LLDLTEINLIIFPDWSQSEESLSLDLERVIGAIATHPDKSKITLLVDTTNISDEDANLILSSAAMNLLMEQDLDVSDGPEIIAIAHLNQIQSKALVPRLHAIIVLEKENQNAIARANLGNIRSVQLESFIQQNY